jgi:F-type H+-transporting ATPase subunit delta
VSYESIARRYAQAIFELGADTGSGAAITREVADFAATYEASAELRSALDNPLVPETEREALLRDVAERVGTSETTQSALLLLLRRRRMAAVPDIARQLGRLADREADIVRATVSSATRLSDDYLARLRAELEKATGKKVVVNQLEDPSLIAGVVTRIGDRVIDGSVKARLASFRDALLTS